MRTHVFEILSNLQRMGHSVRYLNGTSYTTGSISKLGMGTEKNHERSVWSRVIRMATASPFKGEALLLWSLVREMRNFLTATGTVIRRRPDVIYSRHTYFNTDLCVARLFGIPTVKEVNAIGSDELKITGRSDRLALKIHHMIEKYTFSRADRLTVVTPELKHSLQSEFGVDPGKIIVIQNGANTDLFRPMNQAEARRKLGLDQDSGYICFVGALRVWQGVDYLIRSMRLVVKQCPKARLLIVGDGPIREALHALAERIGVGPSVTFIGSVPYSEVPVYINASDVCVAPFIKKLDNKGGLCSLKMYEYLACGKPCVMSRLKGIETVETGHGLSPVEPENVTELAAAIIELLQDNGLRQRMGINGRYYVVHHQSWEKVAGRVAEVFRRVKQRRQRRIVTATGVKDKVGPGSSRRKY